MGANLEKEDCLKRDNFSKFVCAIVKSYAADKQNISFSINGEWGCGKTFVLDKIKNELSPQERFIIFDYNCWQYDYYEEPLVAIVSMMISRLNDNSYSDLKDSLKKLALIGLTFWFCKNGIDFNSFSQNYKEISRDKNFEGFDLLFEFNNKIEEIRELIEKLAEKKTIVFIVDELDRCRPEYAIKVLERLHHISYGVNNFITIIAVDEKSLVKSVGQVYGYEQDEQKKFLKKFIQFSLELGRGEPENCKDKYKKYTELFGDSDNFDGYICLLFKEMFDKKLVIRDQEIIFDRAYNVHVITFEENEDNYDYTIMYMELLLTTFYYLYKDYGFLKSQVNKIIDEQNIEYDYDGDDGLKIIKNNIWHILKWYISFLPLTDKNGELDPKIDRSDGLSIKAAHIEDIDIPLNLKYIKKFSNILKYFK